MPATTTSIDREVIDTEKQYWDATKAGDFQTIERLTADPLVIVMEEGVTQFTPREFADMMRGENFKLFSYSIDEPKVTPVSKDVVSVAYRVHEDFEYQGKRQTRDSFNLSVRKKKGDTWQLAVETMTPAGKTGA